MKIGTTDADAVKERIEQVFGCNRSFFARRNIDFGFPGRLRFGRRNNRHRNGGPNARECEFKLLIARNCFLVQQLHTGYEGHLRDLQFDAIGNDGLLALLRHNDALALIDCDPHFEVAHPQVITVKQAARIAFANRFVLIVNVHAIGAEVGKVINSALVVDGGMASGDIPVGIRQDPFIFERATDRAAVFRKLVHSVIADDVAMLADDFELQWHK